MKNFMLILTACFISLAGFSQEWTWEITGFGERDKDKIEIIFDMIQEPSDPHSARNEDVRIWIPKELIEDKIYPNLPSGKKRRLQDLIGLRFDKNPNTWTFSTGIYPY